MTLLTLSWNFVGPVQIVSGTKLGAIRTKQEVMATLMNLVKSSSYWQLDAIDVTGSFYEALVIKPVSSSAVTNMRLLVTMNATGASGITGPAGVGAADTNTAGYLLLGLTPDYLAGGGGSYVNGRWLGTNPFGGSSRWSYYWGADINASTYQYMYLIESQETLHIGVKGKYSAHNVVVGGALWVAHETGSGEADSRVYGMMTGGSNGIPASFLAGDSFMDHVDTDNTAHAGVFIVSGGVANGPGGSPTTYLNCWDKVYPLWGYAFTVPSDTTYGNTTTADETLVGMPLVYGTDVAGSSQTTRAVGVLRQAYVVHDLPGLVSVVTGVNATTPIGLTLGASQFNSADVVFFSNT